VVVGGGCRWVVGGYFLLSSLSLPRRQADFQGVQQIPKKGKIGGGVHLVLGQVVCFGGRRLSSGDCYIRAECANNNSVRRS